MKTILYVEDDIQIQKAVVNFLLYHNFDAIGVSNAHDGMSYLTKNTVDLVLLDLSLPDFSGEELCHWIKTNNTLPVIMISAKIDEDCVVEGFNLGASDYIKKPFGLKELHARIESVLKTSIIEYSPLSFNNGELVVNDKLRTVYLDNKELPLTEYEYKILKLLTMNHGRVYSRQQLIEGAFGYDYDGYERTIDSHIKNLRAKLRGSRHTDFLKTIRGVGYKFMGVIDTYE